MHADLETFKQIAKKFTEKYEHVTAETIKLDLFTLSYESIYLLNQQ